MERHVDIYKITWRRRRISKRETKKNISPNTTHEKNKRKIDRVWKDTYIVIGRYIPRKYLKREETIIEPRNREKKVRYIIPSC